MASPVTGPWAFQDLPSTAQELREVPGSLRDVACSARSCVEEHDGLEHLAIFARRARRPADITVFDAKSLRKRLAESHRNRRSGLLVLQRLAVTVVEELQLEDIGLPGGSHP